MKRRDFLKGLAAFLVLPTLMPPKKEPIKVDNPIVVGYSGKMTFDAGYVWCPYIPLQVVKS